MLAIFFFLAKLSNVLKEASVAVLYFSDNTSWILHLVNSSFSIDVFVAGGDSEGPADSRPHLTELLADQLNVLSILGIGEVQFVLDHLHQLCTQGSGNGDLQTDHNTDHTTDHTDLNTDNTDPTLLRGLMALTELVLEGEDTKREIVDRGRHMHTLETQLKVALENRGTDGNSPSSRSSGRNSCSDSSSSGSSSSSSSSSSWWWYSCS